MLKRNDTMAMRKKGKANGGKRKKMSKGGMMGGKRVMKAKGGMMGGKRKKMQAGGPVIKGPYS